MYESKCHQKKTTTKHDIQRPWLIMLSPDQEQTAYLLHGYAPVICNAPTPHTHLWGILTPGRFSIERGRAKSKVLTSLSLSPGDWVYCRALNFEN